MSAQIIDGVKIADKIKERLREEIQTLKEKGNPPSLSAIQVGEDPGSKVYIRAQRKSCEKMGIEYNLHQFDEKVTQTELTDFIQKLNKDPRVSGIILQMPLPQHLDARYLQRLIDPRKDAEGVSPTLWKRGGYGRTQ